MASRKAKKPLQQETSTQSKPVKLPSLLSPVMACPGNVLARSRIEFYGGLIVGVFLAIIPMSGLTRSIVLLLVLAPLLDVAWRSAWTHFWKTTSKFFVGGILVVAYLAISTALILHDNPAIDFRLKEYLRSGRAEWLVRLAYFFGGILIAFAVSKVVPFARGYLRSRNTKKLELRHKIRQAQKGWLDYRFESEYAAHHLHDLIARLVREMMRLARVLKLLPWSLKQEDKAVAKSKMVVFWITFVCNKYSTRMEPDLEDLEATASRFIESTEGLLKTFRVTTKGDYEQMAGFLESDRSDRTGIVAGFMPTDGSPKDDRVRTATQPCGELLRLCHQ